MASIDDDSMNGIVEEPPAYEIPQSKTTGSERRVVDTSGDKPEEEQTSQKRTTGAASSSRPTTKLATTRSKPIVVKICRNQVMLGSRPGTVSLAGTLRTEDDIIILSMEMTFTQFEALVLQRCRTKGILPPENDKETVWRHFDLRPDRKEWFQRVLSLDLGNWDAARELLLTDDRASLTVIVGVSVKGFEKIERERVAKERLDQGKRQKISMETKAKKGKCVVQ